MKRPGSGRRPASRRYARGWALSLLLHGLCLAGAVLLVSDLRLAPQPEPFRWEVALVNSPSLNASAPQPAARPLQPVEKPTARPLRPVAQPVQKDRTPPVAAAAVPPPQPARPRVARVKPAEAARGSLSREETAPPDVPSPRRPASKPDYSWLAQALGSRIHALTRYPLEARLNRMEGQVVLQVVILEDGQLVDVEIVKTSGHDVLDHDAREVILRASPLPLKHRLGRSRLVVQVPITYRLDQE